jgi:hypothetical protein
VGPACGDEFANRINIRGESHKGLPDPDNCAIDGNFSDGESSDGDSVDSGSVDRDSVDGDSTPHAGLARTQHALCTDLVHMRLAAAWIHRENHLAAMGALPRQPCPN